MKKKRKKCARAMRGTAFETVATTKSGQNAKRFGTRGPKNLPGTFGAASAVRQIEITDDERKRYQQ